jgi:hypothetical protein
MVVLVVPSLQWVWGAKLLLPFDLIFVLWLLSIRVILQPRTVPLEDSSSLPRPVEPEDSSSSLVRAVGLSLPMVPVVGLSFCPVGVELPSFYPVVQQEELSFLEGLSVVVSWRLVQEVAPFFCRVGVGLLSFYPVVQQEELSFYPVGVQELSFYPVGVQEELSFYPVGVQEELSFLEELLVVVSWRLVQEVGLSFCRAALEVPSSSLTLVAAPGVPSLRLLVFPVVVPVLSFSHREERAVW